MKLSKNGTGLAVLVLSFLGATVSEAQVLDFIASIGQAISFVLLVWNQLDRPDVSNFMFKK